MHILSHHTLAFPWEVGLIYVWMDGREKFLGEGKAGSLKRDVMSEGDEWIG